MTNEYVKPERRKPLIIVVFVTVVLGAAIAWGLSTYLLDLSPSWLAMPVGAVSSFHGFFVLGESIIDAIVFSMFFVYSCSSLWRRTVGPVAIRGAIQRSRRGGSGFSP